MHVPRLATAVVVLGLVGGLATGAVAARPARKACNLVVDVKADAKETPLPGLANSGPSTPALDIVSADLASTPAGLTTVVRVDKLAKTDTTSPLGFGYVFLFKVGEAVLYTRAAFDSQGGTIFDYGRIDPVSQVRMVKLGTATGVMDMAKNEARVTVAPLTGFNPAIPISAGKRAVELKANSYREMGPAWSDFNGWPADRADGKPSTAYAFHQPSCVAVGK